MINHVRNTVLSVLNKENRGTLTVSQFNSYAKYAQQTLFDQYFAEYSRLSTLKNSRRLSKDQGDKLSILRQNIDKFVKSSTIGKTGSSPTHYYQKPSDLYSALSIVYEGKIAEYIPKHKQVYLESSNISAPSALYPGYCDENNYYYIKPITLESDLTLNYIRTLSDPRWTYTVVGENPIFNPSAPDYKDFELNPDDETNLIVEILKLSGVTIREAEVAQAAAQIDAVETQKENV